MSAVREIDASEWEIWRALRLRALHEDPGAFASTLASTLEREAQHGEACWRGCFTRTGPEHVDPPRARSRSVDFPS